jgi:protein-L-isoaspartate(D-aspartate) O-methyltransferase
MAQRLREAGFPEPVVDAMAAIPRQAFAPPHLWQVAYAEVDLWGPTAFLPAPITVAKVLAALGDLDDRSVLEYATGHGYITCLVAALGAKVCTVEHDPWLLWKSSEAFRLLGLNDIEQKASDGALGWKERAPFDGIFVNAAIPSLLEPFTSQLKPGGVLVAPLGPISGPHRLVKDCDDPLQRRLHGRRRGEAAHPAHQGTQLRTSGGASHRPDPGRRLRSRRRHGCSRAQVPGCGADRRRRHRPGDGRCGGPECTASRRRGQGGAPGRPLLQPDRLPRSWSARGVHVRVDVEQMSRPTSPPLDETAFGVRKLEVAQALEPILRPGSSCAALSAMVGTLALDLRALDLAGAPRVLVSCNHVFAGLNTFLAGMPIVAPSREDWGFGVPWVVGHLYAFAPLRFGPYARNRMDAAVASVDWDVALSNDIPASEGSRDWRLPAPCAQARSCRNAAARPGRRQVWWSRSRRRCSSATGRSGLPGRAPSSSTRSSRAG